MVVGFQELGKMGREPVQQFLHLFPLFRREQLSGRCPHIQLTIDRLIVQTGVPVFLHLLPPLLPLPVSGQLLGEAEGVLTAQGTLPEEHLHAYDEQGNGTDSQEP